jgi:hypothetical protein
LSRTELETKAISLAEFAGAATVKEMRTAMEGIWNIAASRAVGDLLPPWSQDI